ncbi:MAG TPA: hypothetical protein VM736_15605 [Gemmatimonadales bacterium]|nr:hypothetical protein [Gemmatimonadales bacterium]
MSTAGPLRQPIPTAHSILWSPASEGKPPGHVPFPVFLSQAALTAIREHLAAPRGPGQGMLGFLLGDQCECPDTNLSYLVVDVALRLNQPIYGDRTRDVVTRIWDHIQQQLVEQRASLIGWYHSHPPLPLTLSAHDVETHEHYFAEPWQVALLVGTDPAEPTGAFFRASSDDQWVTTPLPFYELLSPESIRPDGKRRSFMAWKNYQAYATGGAPPPSISSPRQPAVRMPAEPKFTPAAPAAPPPRPPRAPRPPQPAADTNELVFLTAAEDQPPPAPPPPPPRSRPPSRPAPPVAEQPSRAPAPAPEPEPEPATEPVGASEDEALSWPEEAPEETEVPAPPPVAAERRPSGATRRAPRRRGAWRRRAKAVLWLLVIALLGVGAYKWLVPQLGTVRWSAVAGAWSSRAADAWSALRGKVADAVKNVRGAVAPRSRAAVARTPKPAPRPSTAPSNAPAGAGSAGGAAVPVPPPALGRLSRMADSLSRAVRAFGERARLFDSRQLPCADLARELAAVENRWTAYMVARRGAGVLDAPYAARDQSLYAGVDSVERRYERSGCQRP